MKNWTDYLNAIYECKLNLLTLKHYSFVQKLFWVYFSNKIGKLPDPDATFGGRI